MHKTESVTYKFTNQVSHQQHRRQSLSQKVCFQCLKLRIQNSHQRIRFCEAKCRELLVKLDGGLPANPVNDRRIANAVTIKSTFCLP